MPIAPFNAMAQQNGVAARRSKPLPRRTAVVFERLPNPVRGAGRYPSNFPAKNSATVASFAWEPKEVVASRDGHARHHMGDAGRSRPRTRGDRRLSVRGTYLTVWQKQADGSWKYTHDIGQSDLPPEPAAGGEAACAAQALRRRWLHFSIRAMPGAFGAGEVVGLDIAREWARDAACPRRAARGADGSRRVGACGSLRRSMTPRCGEWLR